MEIEEAASVQVYQNLTETHTMIRSTDSTLQKELFTHEEDGNCKGTQTPGHVFLGKLGEVIITTNFSLVKLLINDTAIQMLADRNFRVEDLQDVVVKSLARLDWNGERILEKAMTSFRLTLTNEMMPRLLREVTDVIKSEAERHKVQHLVEKLFHDFRIKLFGFDVASLVFILEHCSVDDAVLTSHSTERQEKLREVLTSFLPSWASQSAAWIVSQYTLSFSDRSPDFGYRAYSAVSMTTTLVTETESKEDATTDVQLSSALSEQSKPLVATGAHQTLSSVGALRLQQPSVSALDQPSTSHSGQPATGLDQPSTSNLGQPSTSNLGQQATSLDQPSTSYLSQQATSWDQPMPSYLGQPSTSYLGQPSTSYLGQPSTSALEEPSVGHVESSPSEFDVPSLTEGMDTDPPQEVDFRFIMLGRTGSGKSSTANTILGQDVFPAAMSFSSVTTECQLKTLTHHGVSLQILDCPGLFDTTMSHEEVSGLVMKAVSTLEDGPDAVLYIIKIGKYTEEEFAVYNMLKALLDENVTRYLVIVFTHGDVIKGMDFDDVIKKTPPTLQQVLGECGNRYVVFDNTAAEKKPQVERLFDIVRRLKSQNNGRPYRCPKYAEKLVELDEELEQRLAKVERERLERRRYLHTLRSQLAQAQRALAAQRQRLKKEEEDREKERERHMRTMQQSLQALSASVTSGQQGEREREREMRALRERLEEERKEGERARGEEELKRKEMEVEYISKKLRETGDRLDQELERQRQAELSRLRSQVQTVRRRRQNACCVM